MKVVFEAKGIGELTGQLRTADTIINISINEGLRMMGHLFVPAKGTGPLADETPKITGKLARSSYFEVMGGPEDQRLEVKQPAQSENGVFYGYIVREGRGPVHAKNVKALHFYIGGREFFRKSVGPAAANPYHKRVFARLESDVQKIVNDMGKRIVATLSGK